MPDKGRDLLIVAICTLISVIAVIVKLPIPVLRVGLTLPLVLVLPGYALVAMLFPRRLPDLAERWVMILALSLSVTATTGLLLNWSARGLSEISWLIALPGITWGACLIALVRRRTLNTDFLPAGGDSLRRYAVLAGVLLCFAFIAIGVSRIGEASQPRTQFSALSAVQNGQGRGLEISIANQELTSTSYQLSILVDGIMIEEVDAITVETKSTGKLQVELPDGASGKIEIILYKADQPGVAYRSLILWV